MAAIFCLLLLVLFTIINPVRPSDNVTVRTTEGTVMGTKSVDGDYVVFYGIPYAGVVSGENRFKRAPDPPPYDKFEANKRVLCAQPGPQGLIGVEDCLTLNIYTSNFSNLMPVIVWIFGEEYSTADTTGYSYKSYVESDIVNIEVNYRLSIFGFLCLGVNEAPGNAGLKDVLQALDWISKNIQAFGGDPNNVLLIGHGSAAAMVDLLTLSLETKGLIQKAIVISGSALSPWAVAYDPVGYAKSFAGNVLTSSDLETNSKIAAALQKIEPQKLVEEINKIGIRFTNQSLLFAPCIEHGLRGTFLTKPPLQLLQSGAYNHVSYIAGYVVEEGTVVIDNALDNNWLNIMENNFTAFLPVNIEFENTATEKSKAKFIRETYFDNKTIDFKVINDFLDYHGETMIQSPMIKSIQERARTSKQPVRFFLVNYKEMPLLKWIHNISLVGLPHGRIIDYILDERTPIVPRTLQDYIVKRIKAFAKTGIPTTRAGDLIGNVVWPEFAASSEYLMISGPSHDNSNDQTEAVFEQPKNTMAWDKFYEHYYRHPPIYSLYQSDQSGSSSAHLILLITCASLILVALNIILLRHFFPHIKKNFERVPENGDKS